MSAAPASELKRRVATGFIGGFGLLALIIFGGSLGNFVFVTVISVCMLYEFGTISFALFDERRKRALLVALGFFVNFSAAVLSSLAATHAEFELLVLSFLSLAIFFLFTARRHEGMGFEAHFKELLSSTFGLVYLAFVPLYLRGLYLLTHGVHWLILFLLIVFAGDTGAYFSGRRFGKTRLYPLISPKKTVEGALGGLLSGLLIAWIYKLAFLTELGWIGATILALLVGVVAQIGDLCESFLKRAFDKKDSGSLLPGHGGFLDRFDGVVFAAPVMYACIRVFTST